MTVRCPKDRKTELESSTLSGNLAVQCCSDCKGTWIPAAEYETWQSQHDRIHDLPATLDVDYVQSPFDTKAALCPECNHYLSRAKVSLKTPFYVERCPNCNGIWCDHGEWEVLEKLGLHTAIEHLFTSEWQIRIKARETAEREREATIEKLGEDLAARVFDLAERLENHPNGDFGVAYLMRRFDR
ncbi:zf-TFIIB domain-containing protein [Microcoleus sp. FACHB-1515]|uniref:zf-TFIIB domain-containing protein n=1 Tax=Cyanophyceae TaxID=3028117 RepID=UPI0018F0316A|nr:zf-TFIIB domain-containing protein [Microcoleus sp. FACHB-1515]